MFSKKVNYQNIKFIVFVVLFANIIHVSSGHTADNSTKTTEVIFEADTIEINQNEGVIIAEKNVLFQQGQYKMRADKVIYNQSADIGNAYGNVTVTTEDGITTKADKLQLNENFQNIVASPLLTILSDGSRFRAQSGERKEGIKAVYNNGVFSPCICDYEAGETPIWDLRSSKIFHDYQSGLVYVYVTIF